MTSKQDVIKLVLIIAKHRLRQELLKFGTVYGRIILAMFFYFAVLKIHVATKILELPYTQTNRSSSGGSAKDGSGSDLKNPASTPLLYIVRNRCVNVSDHCRESAPETVDLRSGGFKAERANSRQHCRECKAVIYATTVIA